MVKYVIEDTINNKIEFLKMMSKKKNEEIGENFLLEAFK